ncbi:MAG: DUF4279 domain-containing protein [Planctomycetia bacterium]|nr:DUF4279 domain-containing protein [Planctomycetia bacterium]
MTSFVIFIKQGSNAMSAENTTSKGTWKFSLESETVLPEQMSARLKTRASRIWYKGDPIHPSKLTTKTNGWTYSIGPFDPGDASVMLSRLLSALFSDAAAIKDLVRSGQVAGYICYSIYLLENGHFPVTVKPSELAQLSQMGISLDFDLNVYAADAES